MSGTPGTATLGGMTDDLTAAYGDLLDGSYDCVDRIVLNADDPLCHSAGGFRKDVVVVRPVDIPHLGMCGIQA